MKNLKFQVLPDGDTKISVVASGEDTGFSEAGDIFPRLRPNLSPDQLEELRLGAPAPDVVDEVAEALSNWLLSNDLRYALDAELDTGGEQGVRLVFAVDERLPPLAEMPLELLRLDDDSYLLLDPRVSAIVHLLPKVGSKKTPPESAAGRLKILIVRSNPGDLGGVVPAAAPLRDAIVKLAAGIGSERVAVEVISSEAGIGKPAMWETVREELKGGGYHILVYLGHGDLRGEAAVGVLQFECPGGEAEKKHEDVQSTQIKTAVGPGKYPVVLVMGCLTAAGAESDILERLNESAPDRVRGSQGVAQQLVNSPSGVHIAIGMRYRITPDDAGRFLRAFFRSLLQEQPGHLDAAVRAGREDLYAASPLPPSWSAPVVFRSPRTAEPYFDFLNQPLPPQPPSPDAPEQQMQDLAADEQDQQVRLVAWDTLTKQPLSTRLPDSSNLAYNLLEKAENAMRARALSKGPLLMPGRGEGGPHTVVSIPVTLYGNLAVETLAGSFVLGDESASLEALVAAIALEAAGYRLEVADSGGSRKAFRIERKSSDALTPLPQGKLFEVTVTLGDAFPVFYAIGLEDLVANPSQHVQVISNAMVVPAP